MKKIKNSRLVLKRVSVQNLSGAAGGAAGPSGTSETVDYRSSITTQQIIACDDSWEADPAPVSEGESCAKSRNYVDGDCV